MATLAPPGAVAPRVEWHADSVTSAGQEVIDLAATCGVVLDAWQCDVLIHALAERTDGKWQHRDVGGCVTRQNGKGEIILARTLGGLFLFGEELIAHSAHLFPTAMEGMRRLQAAIEANPDMERMVKRVSRSHGEEGIELMSGQRVLFKTRTKDSMRGFSGDLIVLDEAMVISEDMYGALLPTLSARPNPQVWLLGSAVDQVTHEHGFVFSRMRNRGIAGGDPTLAWFEWSIDAKDPESVPDEVLSDPEVWRQANPAFGIRIDEESVAAELKGMSRRKFAVERLGVGDWPQEIDADTAVISVEVWRSLADPYSVIAGPMWLGVDVSPNRDWTTITAVGSRSDGLLHVEVIDHQPGTTWVPSRMVELVSRHNPDGVVCDAIGQAGALGAQLERAGISVTFTDTRDMVRACGEFFDRATDGGVRHLGDQLMEAAVEGAARRNVGDAWAWARRSSEADITPLVAGTLALWASVDQPVEWEAV